MRGVTKSKSLSNFEKHCACFDGSNAEFYSRSFVRPKNRIQFFEKKDGETFVRESRLNRKATWMPRPTSNVDFFDPLHKATLRFICYLNETDGEHGELLKIRPMRLAFHLDDETFSMNEPHIDNSGHIQGRIFHRQRILREKDRKTIGPDHLGWRDIVIGKDISIFGKSYRVVSCDAFTKSFYEDRGIEMPESSDTLPIDAWTMMRNFGVSRPSDSDPNADVQLLHNLHLNEDADLRSWEPMPPTLTFLVAWLDSENDFHIGNVKRTFRMSANTSDDTVTLMETTPGFNNALFLRNSKLPYNSQSGVTRYHRVRHMRPGSWIEVFRRHMFIYDCEGEATMRFLRQQYGETRFADCTIEILKRGPPPEQFHTRPAQSLFLARNDEFPKMEFIFIYNHDTQRVDIFESGRLRQWTKARPFLLSIDASHVDTRSLRAGSQVTLFRWTFNLVKAHPSTQAYLDAIDFQPSANASPRTHLGTTPALTLPKQANNDDLVRRLTSHL